MNIYDHVFTSAQSAKAAVMSAANFRAQFTRGNWRIIGKERPGNGEAHLFTIYDVLAYALARRLMIYGFEPAHALDIAIKDFAMASTGDRKPGGTNDPIKYGRTFFIASISGGPGQCLAENEIKNPIQLLIPPMCNRSHDAVIIDLYELRSSVFRSLGLDSRDYE